MSCVTLYEKLTKVNQYQEQLKEMSIPIIARADPVFSYSDGVDEGISISKGTPIRLTSYVLSKTPLNKDWSDAHIQFKISTKGYRKWGLNELHFSIDASTYEKEILDTLYEAALVVEKKQARKKRFKSKAQKNRYENAGLWA